MARLYIHFFRTPAAVSLLTSRLVNSEARKSQNSLPILLSWIWYHGLGKL